MERLNNNIERLDRPAKSGFFVKGGHMDMPFFLLSVALTVFGLITLFSSSYATAYYDTQNSTYYFMRQVRFAVGGMVIMILASKVNYQYYRSLSFPILAVSILFLILVPFVGIEKNGAVRWLKLGPIEFQPSEIAKLAVVLTFSSMISVYKDRMKTLKGLIPFIAILAVIAFLMMQQPHISGTVIIFAIGAAMLFVGGVHWGLFVGGIGLVGGIGYLVITKMDYATSRLAVFKDPWVDPLNKGWQTIQSLYALGSGGLLGLGLGKSRQKFFYLPEESNDYIFSVACEELGFIGGTVIIVLFALLIVRGYWIAMHTRDRFGCLLVIGIVTMLAVQVFLNIAVVTKLIPATGISLPFFSYGGTALVIQMVEIGIVLAVSRQNPVPKAG